MEKVIITGKDSYIGNHIQEWLEQKEDCYDVGQLDVKSDSWRKSGFTGTDVIIHVAGIVHRPKVKSWELYEKINIDLPVEIAGRAKKDGVKQFIFFSTMAVYGIGKQLEPAVIDRSSPLRPADMYGKSKYLAEQKLEKMADNNFIVSIVRPPNVYGRNCRGKYMKGFVSIVKILPVIPAVYENVKQSMLYIDNLSEAVRLIIENKKSAVFMLQDTEAVSAVTLMQKIAVGLHKNIKTSKCFGFFVHLLSFLPAVKKVYGGVEYSLELSDCFNNSYAVVPFEEAIRRTVENA